MYEAISDTHAKMEKKAQAWAMAKAIMRSLAARAGNAGKAVGRAGAARARKLPGILGNYLKNVSGYSKAVAESNLAANRLKLKDINGLVDSLAGKYLTRQGPGRAIPAAELAKIDQGLKGLGRAKALRGAIEGKFPALNEAARQAAEATTRARVGTGLAAAGTGAAALPFALSEYSPKGGNAFDNSPYAPSPFRFGNS